MCNLVLPRLPSPGWKYAAGLLCVAIAALLYLVPNRMTLGAAVALPLSAVDRALPFWPGSGWIYAAVYPLLLTTFVAVTDLERASRFLYACLFAQLVAAAVFVLFPTAFPRELFPVPAATHPLNTALVEFFRGLDAPANCLPSLHVSTTVLCVAALASSAATRLVPWSAALGVLLAASTLTFKQHYFVDVVAGFALGVAAYWLFFRWRRIALASG